MDTPIKSTLKELEYTNLPTPLSPNLLLLHYVNLSLTDAHLTLILHIINRSPGQELVDFPMSANLEIRRRLVRDLRERGLLFTARVFSEAGTGPNGSTAWYLGSLFHNLMRVHHWLTIGKPLEVFQIEIPLKTVAMFLKGKFHDTAPNVAQAIRSQTRDGIALRPVMVTLMPAVIEKVKRQKDQVIRDQQAKRRRYEFSKKRALMRKLLINRDGYKCARCGTTQNLTIDHKIPISEGGLDELGNLQFLCLRHNSQKGKRVMVEKAIKG